MNKNLLENLMIAQYAAETDMHYPRYMLALAKDTKRLAKFLDDFLYEEDDNEKPKTVLTLRRSINSRFDLEESCKLRQIIQARIDSNESTLQDFIEKRGHEWR